MLPITKLRTKTATYRGEQRMLDGIEHMKHAGWRVVTTSEEGLPTLNQRFLVLAHISAQLVQPKSHFTVILTWPQIMRQYLPSALAYAQRSHLGPTA